MGDLYSSFISHWKSDGRKDEQQNQDWAARLDDRLRNDLDTREIGIVSA